MFHKNIKKEDSISRPDKWRQELQNRIVFIDYSRAIGIILVIAGHINMYNSFCKVWIYSFHMPLFFLLSGMLIAPEMVNFKGFIVKRIRRLIVPFVIWGLIYAPLSIKNFLLICYGSYNSLSMADSLTSLWFFPVLFLSAIVGKILISGIEKSNKKALFYILSIGGVLIIGFLLPGFKYGYPFGLNVAFIATGFVLIGKCAFGLLQRIRQTKYYILAIILVASALISGIAFINIPDNGYVLMANNYYANPILFLLSALAGSLFIIGVAILLERLCSRFNCFRRVFLYIGTNTIALMLIHKPIINACERLMGTGEIPTGVAFLIVLVITIIICCLITVVINFFIPQIVGGEYKRKASAT